MVVFLEREAKCTEMRESEGKNSVFGNLLATYCWQSLLGFSDRPSVG